MDIYGPYLDIYGHIWAIYGPYMTIDGSLDRRSWDMQNSEADLFMMVSKPSEANVEFQSHPRLGYAEFRGGTPKYDFLEVAKKMGLRIYLSGSSADCRRSRESNQRQWRPGEGQAGPNKGYLDPKLGNKNEETPFHPGITVNSLHVFWSSSW